MIYHYCSADVFSSIIKTKEVWLTDITKLNDRIEYSAGADLVNEVLASKGLQVNEFLSQIGVAHLNTTFQILIGCFSLDGDSGSQFRLYADDCHGLSIGFDEGHMELCNLGNRFVDNSLEPITTKVRFRRSEYHRDTFVRKVTDFIETLEQNNPILKYEMMAVGLQRYAVCYKIPFYKHEEEVRAVIELQFSRDDRYEIGTRTNAWDEEASYHKLLTSFGELSAIKEVIIGPLCSWSLEQVQAMLASNGLPDVQVKYSSGRGSYRSAVRRCECGAVHSTPNPSLDDLLAGA